jgi:glycosyltransferase involved in cell wall biosynthesis
MSTGNNRKTADPQVPVLSGNRTAATDGETRSLEYDYDFTVFIPTYNRAYVLRRTVESIASQTYRNFEVLIIDDGSTDGTDELVRTLRMELGIPIVYHWQQNQGHLAAHNHAISLAKGRFFIRLDSNDCLLPEALEKLMEHWNLIPVDERELFAGVVGLCLEEDGTLAGSPFPQDTLDSDYLKMAATGNISGEKREATRTSVLRKYPYPTIEGERHIRPTMIFWRMALDYRMRFINVPLMVNRHAPEGITRNRFEYRMRNPKGLRLVFQEQITMFSSYLGPRKLLRSHIRFVRYSLHSGVGLIRQSREVKHHLFWIMALPMGIFKWSMDMLRKTVKGV